MHCLQLNDGLPTHKAIPLKSSVCSSLNCGGIHYLDVALLQFSILSVYDAAGLSWRINTAGCAYL